MSEHTLETEQVILSRRGNNMVIQFHKNMFFSNRILILRCSYTYNSTYLLCVCNYVIYREELIVLFLLYDVLRGYHSHKHVFNEILIKLNIGMVYVVEDGLHVWDLAGMCASQGENGHVRFLLSSKIPIW